MNILISNDDGVFAPGILAAKQAVEDLANVTVVGPDKNNSSIGRRITLFNHLKINSFALEDGSSAYSVSGSPADAVIVGVDYIMDEKPDLVIAGINQGVNISCDITSSGTVCAALEAGDILVVDGVNYAVAQKCTFSGGAGDVYVVGGAKAEHAQGAAVNYVGGADADEYTCNLAFHPMAFAYVSRPLINPDGQGVASYVTSYNGISLRVTKGYDQKFKRSIYSMDVLYGFKTVYPELAVRVLG